MNQHNPPPPWHAAFPSPSTTLPVPITCSELLNKFRQHHEPGVDFLLIDLRRTDFEGGTIRGSLNLPAQTIYRSLPTIWNLCVGTKIKSVIFYCNSSRGRGTRAAGWFDDLIRDKGVTGLQSLVLFEGIEGWAKAGPDYVSLMDGYDSKVWDKSS